MLVKGRLHPGRSRRHRRHLYTKYIMGILIIWMLQNEAVRGNEINQMKIPSQRKYLEIYMKIITGMIKAHLYTSKSSTRDIST